MSPTSARIAYMIEALAAKIRDIKDFPKKGIVFKDITPLLGDPQTFNMTINLLADRYIGRHVYRVVGVEEGVELGEHPLERLVDDPGGHRAEGAGAGRKHFEQGAGDIARRVRQPAPIQPGVSAQLLLGANAHARADPFDQAHARAELWAAGPVH